MQSEYERWLGGLKRNTASSYRVGTQKFFKFCQIEPDESLAWDSRRVEREMQRCKDSLVSEGKDGGVISVFWTATKRWFEDGGIPITKKLRGVKRSRKSLDYIPTKKDLVKLLNHANLKYKTAISLMAFSGLRPVDVCALQYQHLKQSFERGDQIIEIVMRQRKTEEWFFTFLAPEGVDYLKQYLDERKRKGEQISDESHIIAKNGGGKLAEKSLKWELDYIIKKSIGKNPTGEKFRRFRPYNLRKYFKRATRPLGDAVSEFLMGHKANGLETIYSGIKDLDQVAIAELKKEYCEILPDLQTGGAQYFERQKELEEKIMQQAEEMEKLRARLVDVEAFMARRSERVRRANKGV